MDRETKQESDPDGILPQWPHNYALSGKDALAMVSFLVFLLVPMDVAFYAVGKWFGVVNGIPLRDQLHSSGEWLFMAATATAAVVLGLMGKYLWLVAMCRVLTRANVGPLIAYGLPRRISRFDRSLVKRLYRSRGPALETKLRSPKPIGYIIRVHGTIYAIGALLSAALGVLPLMRGDRRPLDLAGFFGVIVLLHVGLAYYAKRKDKKM